MTAFAALNWRERKIPSGSIGLALRCSCQKKPTSAATPITAVAMTAAAAPSGASISA